jgi:arylsulfatase A-like enzyme
MCRRSLSILLALVAASLSLFASSCSRNIEHQQPNIVVVLVDALRPDHLGSYGYDQPTSPYLDKLAIQGIVFDDAWSQGSQTLLSTASFFTSKFFAPVAFVPPSRLSTALTMSENKETDTIKFLVPIVPSFPAVLSEHGYDTAAFLSNPHHHRISGFPDIFDESFLLIDGEDFEMTKGQPYADGTEVVRRVTDWLSRRDGSGQPYLAYIHLMDVHNPYRAPAEFRDRFVTAVGTDRYQNAKLAIEDMPSEEDLEFMIQSYDAEIAYVDSLIKEVHQKAVASSSRPLLIVVTSDHGDEFLEHGGFGHGRTLEMELLRVPLIVHGGQIEPRREGGLVRLVDVGPSLLDVVGVPMPQDWDGHAVFRSVPESVMLIESVANYGRLMSITTSDWHAVWNRSSDEVVLYDRRNDPRCLTNVADVNIESVEDFRDRFTVLAEVRAETNREIRGLMDDIVDQLSGFNSGAGIEEQLRALGYVN